VADSQLFPHRPIKTGAPHFHRRTDAARPGRRASL